ncbi:MAG: hypothetical protein HOP29_10080 [Phycisphaerales bacterium]|nr:hypothetical protein [Phycisphaerales bacterium]
MVKSATEAGGHVCAGLFLLGCAGLLGVHACIEVGGLNGGGDGDPIPLKEAKLNIEHNATDEDTGFQGFIDSEGWERLDITGPDGVVFTVEGGGRLRSLGLTELFFESVEPANADVPIADILATLPEGEYTIEGPTPDGNRTTGTALLTHDIPAGPVLVSPVEGATVPPANLVMSWEPVTRTITGEAVTIVAYQLIVEVDEMPHPHALAKRVMSVHVRPAVTSVTVPNEFLEPGTPYKWEVLAIEESGNQTLSSSDFATADDGTIPATVPDFAATTFSQSTVIDNPLFPLPPGRVLTYQGETMEGTERIVIEVLSETREVMGVTCRVVRDRAFVDDVIVEDTFDWFAQDDAGNVWYMGEVVDDYNYDEAGNFIDITHGGVWEAGLDVAGSGVIARPGMQMRASPAAGDVYHQEYYAGSAEDQGEVVALDVSVTLGDGTDYTCLQVRDFTLLHPGADEYKYYAPGVGLVLEEPVAGGERIELISSEP